MTEKGQNLVKIIERENKYSNETSLEGLTTDEKDTLLRLLTKVAENASESWKFVKNGGRREY